MLRQFSHTVVGKSRKKQWFDCERAHLIGYNGQVVVLTDRTHVTIYKAASMSGIGCTQIFEMMGAIEDEGVLEV